jgi:Protein of unknown function (DUF3040)
MLSDHDRRLLAEIERHLQDDAGMCRAFGRTAARSTSRSRRTWFTLLLVSLVLMVGTAALGASGAAVECGALATMIAVGLRLAVRKPRHRTGRGRVPGRRS